MDSCCFIELALESLGKSDAERQNDLWFLKELLNAAFDQEIEVLTSTLSIAECSHAKGDVSEDVKSLFRRLLTSGRYVFLIQDSVLVAEKARNLRWAHGLSFGGADSIHIASAMELRCDEFLTWDNRPHANATALDDLALPIRLPRNTHCLPDQYRQQQLVPPSPPAEDIGSRSIELSDNSEQAVETNTDGTTQNESEVEPENGEVQVSSSKSSEGQTPVEIKLAGQESEEEKPAKEVDGTK
jgi:hypothetical protein